MRAGTRKMRRVRDSSSEEAGARRATRENFGMLVGGTAVESCVSSVHTQD